jgi:hypothetical protein
VNANDFDCDVVRRALSTAPSAAEAGPDGCDEPPLCEASVPVPQAQASTATPARHPIAAGRMCVIF